METSKYIISVAEEDIIFYKTNINQIAYKKLKDKALSDEVILEIKCQKFLNAVLASDNKIYLFIQNLNNSINMYTFFDDKIVDSILLINSINIDYAEIISAQNCLNLFYTNYLDKTCILYHKVINQDLSTSNSLMLDTILNISNEPFKTFVDGDIIFINYIKDDGKYSLGYKKLNLKSKSWSRFYFLDIISSHLIDFSFLSVDKDIISYCYAFNKNNIFYFKTGWGLENHLEKKIIKSDYAIFNCSLCSIFDKFYFMYTTKDKLVINSLTLNEINLHQKIFELRDDYKVLKFFYETPPIYNVETDNTILGVLYNKELKLVTAEFIKKIDTRLYEKQSNLNPIRQYGNLIRKISNYEKQINKNQEVLSRLNYTVKDLKNKNSFYEEKFKLITNLNVYKKNDQSLKLKNTISNINRNLIKKESTISDLQQQLSTQTTYIDEKNQIIENLNAKLSNINLNTKNLSKKIDLYENKIKDLTNINSNLESEYNKCMDTISNLNKQIELLTTENKNLSKQNEDLINQSENLYAENENLNKQITILNKEIDSLKEESNKSIIKKLFN